MSCKVLMHVSASQFPPLNINHSTKDIWIELAKGFDSYHLIARSLSNKFEYYNDGNIHLHLIPKIGNKSRWFILTSWFVIFYFFRIKPNYILCQSSIFGGAVCVLIKKVFKVPVLMEIHGEEYFRILEGKAFKQRLGAFYIRKIFTNSTKVRSLNSVMSLKLKKHNVFNVVEIQNRVNIKIFKKIKDDYGINSDNVKLISVGRFVKEKNYLNLIKALLQSGLKFHLTLIGGGPLKADYLDFIIAAGSFKNFTLIDWCSQDELVDHIVNCDIYIQSSISEGMPRTIIEAMALRMPIITSDVGSITGVVEDNVNGILISPDLLELKPALENLIENISLRKRIAEAAYEDAISKYDWDSCFEIYRNQILSMCNGR